MLDAHVKKKLLSKYILMDLTDNDWYTFVQ
jgi:hypothetical protein